MRNILYWSWRNGSCYNNRERGEKLGSLEYLMMEVDCDCTAHCKSAALKSTPYMTRDLALVFHYDNRDCHFCISGTYTEISKNG